MHILILNVPFVDWSIEQHILGRTKLDVHDACHVWQDSKAYERRLAATDPTAINVHKNY